MGHRQMAGGCIGHEFRHHERVHPIFALFIDRPKIIIPGVHPTCSGSKNHTRRFRQLLRDLQARLRHRLATGQKHQLSHPIIECQFLPIKMRFRIKILDLPTDFYR